jgi:hypothetical protein
MAAPYQPYYVEVAGGYDFNVAWASTLSSVQNTALSFYEFQLFSNFRTLSFKAEITSALTSGGVINLAPHLSSTQINIISFSILVITDATAEIEIVTQSSSSLNSADLQHTINFPTTQFASDTVEPYCMMLMQWVTGSGTVQSGTYNYWYKIVSSAWTVPWTVMLILDTDITYFLTGIKINGLFVKKQVLGYSLSMYYSTSMFGNALTPILIVDFGVDVTLYGQPITSHRCFFNLVWLNIHLNSQSTGIILALGSLSSVQGYWFNGI